jgi:hypothetical protein
MNTDREEIVRLKAEIVKLSDDIVFMKHSYENTIAGCKTIINNYGVRLGLDPVRTLRVSYKNNGALILFAPG